MPRIKNTASKENLPLRLTDLTLYFERGPRVLAIHPYICWIGIGIDAALISVLFHFFTKHWVFLRVCVPIITGCVIIPMLIRFGVSSILKWHINLGSFVVCDPVELDSWFRKQLHSFLLFRIMSVCGTLWGSIVVVAYHHTGYFTGLALLPSVFAHAIVFCGGFFPGVALAYMFFWMKLTWSLGSFQVRVESHPLGVMSTGKLLARFFGFGALVWMIMSFTGMKAFNLSGSPVTFLPIPSMLLLFGGFVVAQLPLHRQMLAYKYKELRKLDSRLSTQLDSLHEQLTDDHQRRIQFLEERISKVTNLPEWPFGWVSLLGVFISALSTVLPAIIEAGLASGALAVFGQVSHFWTGAGAS